MKKCESFQNFQLFNTTQHWKTKPRSMNEGKDGDWRSVRKTHCSYIKLILCNYFEMSSRLADISLAKLMSTTTVLIKWQYNLFEILLNFFILISQECAKMVLRWDTVIMKTLFTEKEGIMIISTLAICWLTMTNYFQCKNAVCELQIAWAHMKGIFTATERSVLRISLEKI